MPVQRFPLAGSANEREPAAAKDPLLKNCFQETVMEGVDENGKPKETVYVVKRGGLSVDTETAVAAGRAIYNWDGVLYAFVGDEVFKDGVDIGSTLNTSTGRMYCDQAFDGSGLLVAHDGVTIYTIASDDTLRGYNTGGTGDAGGVECTAVGALPSAFMPGIVVLNQYLFVMDVQGNIHSSDVGAVTTWSGDSLNMEIKSDAGVGLARYLNYLAGFGDQTTELFYDAGNVNGSPLNRFEGMASLVGCAAGATIANCDSSLIMVAKSPDGGRFVGQMDEGFGIKRISTNAIDELLDKEKANITNAYAFHIRHAGKNFYVLTLKTTAARTFVYDLDEKKWYQWLSGTTYWTPMASTTDAGKVLLLDEDNGDVLEYSMQTYQDDSVTQTSEIRTKKFDMDTMQNKFLARLQAIGDLNASTGTINIAWSDDDYQNWSTNRAQDLDNSQSWLTRCGMFKRRAFRIQHTQNLPMRLTHLEGNGRTGHYARS